MMQTVSVGPSPRLTLSVAGEGDLVLFLHGIRGSRRHWARQIEFFSRRFLATAWDARGYGDSEDYEGPLDFTVFSADVLRVLDHFGARKAHLVGLSMGGRIARNFALRHPERLHSLTLANTSPGFGVMEPEKVRQFVEQRRRFDPPTQAKSILGPDASASAYETLVASLSAVHRDSYMKTIEASVAQDLAAPIENIAVRTLVITSTHDSLYPRTVGQDMARRIPHARLAVIERAGHLSNLEKPDEFNRIALEFISGAQS